MLNSSIILAGQQPDIVNTLARADQAGAQANQIARNNALNELFKAQGADIAAGDQNALNALAAFDPTAALGIQGTRQDMSQSAGRYDMAREAHGLDMRTGQRRLDLMNAQERRAIEQHAASLSAAEAAQQKADIESDLAVLMTAQTPDQWDALAQQTGNPDMVGGFQNREAAIAPFLGLKEVLDRQTPTSDSLPSGVQTLQFRAEQAGLKPGTPEYQQFMLNNGEQSDAFSFTASPDGTVELRQGSQQAGGNGKSLTVDEGKNTGFLLRARESGQILDNLENEGTGLFAKIANEIPIAGNYMQTPEYRQYDQARRDFINAVLRRESGAVISDQEFANAERQYFPQPGDDPGTIAQKRANRAAAIQGFEIGAGDGVNRIEPQQPQGTVDFSAMGPAEMLGADLSAMGEADLQAYISRMDELGL